MLTQDDLQAIGQVIDERVPKIINDLVPPMIAAGLGGLKVSLETYMDTKFDAMHETFEALESTVVTKAYLDERLADYVRKPRAA